MSRLIDADALKETICKNDYILRDLYHSTDKGMFTHGILYAIDEQPTIDASERQWAPCTERPPKENGEYLCQERQGFLYVDIWDGECWEIAYDNNGNVVAWMPLPDPYKGGNDD